MAKLRNWCVVAVDPGISPTMCAWWDRGESAKFYDKEHTAGDYRRERPKEKVKNRQQPSAQAIRAILEFHQPHLVVIEKIWVRPKQGVVSSARLVYSMALVDGIATGMGLNILRVFPTTWMKFHNLITHDKAHHRYFAGNQAPQWGWAFTRVKDHDRADAMLMAMMGEAYLDRAYERAVSKGAPDDFIPPVDAVR